MIHFSFPFILIVKINLYSIKILKSIISSKYVENKWCTSRKARIPDKHYLERKKMWPSSSKFWVSLFEPQSYVIGWFQWRPVVYWKVTKDRCKYKQKANQYWKRQVGLAFPQSIFWQIGSTPLQSFITRPYHSQQAVYIIACQEGFLRFFFINKKESR